MPYPLAACRGGHGSLGGPAFVPTDIAGLQLWNKTPIAGLVNDDPVVAFADDSGNANNATSPGDFTYKTNIINSLPIVRGLGVGAMSLTSNIVLAGAFTLYVVGNRAVNSVWLPIGASGTAAVTIWSDNQTYTFDDSGAVVNIAFTGSTGNIVARWRRSAVGSAIKLCVTGMAEADIGILGTMTFNRLFGRTGAGQYSVGDFGEDLLYNSDLTAGQRTSVETYINSRWGVSL